ncbi:MAG TPA: hypothetical protein VH988_31310 [Thermoanaerobaculia bacterium]|jgi:hypothetical protein|nr:hypothetical protein [Thermoanaerobaculia bacterium]
MSLSERIQQINREISATVDSALAELRRDVAERVRASSEEIARHVEALAPRLPASFLAHEDLSQVAESMAREAADQASREAAGKAAAAAAAAAHQAAGQVAAAARSGAVDLRDALQAVDRARSQADILAALLREAQRFAGRTAVVLVRGNEMRGWGGHGFGDADAALRDLAFTPGATGGWARLAQGQSAIHLSAADAGELCSRIEAPLPHEGVLIPLVLRDRVAAGLYADRADQDGGLPAVEALQILCYTAAQAIELLPFRERAFTATLATGDGLAYMPPAAPAAAEPPAAAAPVTAPEEPLATARIETLPQTAAEELPEIEVEAEPEPPGDALVEAAAPWAPAAPEQEIEAEALPELPAELPADLPPELPDTALEAEPEPAPAPPPYSPAATVYQPIPREALRSFEETPQAPGVTRLTTPMPLPPPELASSSPDETVMLQRPSLREMPPEAPPPAPAPPPLRSVPPPAPEPPAEAPSLAGIPEVKPPSGVEGPGWAFATSRVAVSPNEEALHEEARRLARLLVSEIKLYNEEQVEEGRRKKDVYERLKEDIDRSRQMYEERVEPRILKSTDYFYQELVRILAAGDSKALGI